MNLKATAVGSAHEPTLHCPNCNHEIKLTESLAAPLIEETRRRFQDLLSEVARKTEVLRREQEAVAKAREQIEDQVAQRLSAERSQLVAAQLGVTPDSPGTLAAGTASGIGAGRPDRLALV